MINWFWRNEIEINEQQISDLIAENERLKDINQRNWLYSYGTTIPLYESLSVYWFRLWLSLYDIGYICTLPKVILKIIYEIKYSHEHAIHEHERKYISTIKLHKTELDELGIHYSSRIEIVCESWSVICHKLWRVISQNFCGIRFPEVTSNEPPNFASSNRDANIV